MAKRDDLIREVGGNIRESMGVGGGTTPTMGGATLPDRLRGVGRRKDLMDIPLDKIVRDEMQPRQEFNPESLRRLAESLRVKGQLQPIRVRWDGEAYVILVGERRWRAARLAGLETVTAIVHGGEIEAADLLAAQLVENAQREDLKPIEQANAYRRLLDHHGWTTRRLAEELSVSQSSVSHSLRLLDLPEEVQEKVEQGVLAPTAAYEISKLPESEQVAVADQVIAGKVRRDDIRAPRRWEYRSGPYVVTVRGPVDDEDGVRAALLDAAGIKASA